MEMSVDEIPVVKFRKTNQEGEIDPTQSDFTKMNRMRKRDSRKSFMFYPEDHFKTNWDLYVTIILLFTCLATPYLISFEKDTIGWIVVNYFIDTCFLIDIVFSFNQAFYDDDFVIIEDRKIIGC
jgi:hypothetical protein